MSRVRGRIARELLKIFDRNSRKSFKTSLLCRLVYKIDLVEKKHRVAVLRALRTLADHGDVVIGRWQPRFEKADVEWFNVEVIGRPRDSTVLAPKRKDRVRGLN